MKKILFITCMVLGLGYHAWAQGGPGFDDDTDDVPVDGGISVLVGLGAAYGVKKYLNSKKEEESLS